MSKSYKKTPCYKDSSKDIPKGKGYRKIFNRWIISDYKFHETWKEHLIYSQERSMYCKGRKLNFEEIKKLKNQWEKCFKRK